MRMVLILAAVGLLGATASCGIKGPPDYPTATEVSAS